MTPFAEIFALAAERKGGKAALEQILAKSASRSPAEIAAIPDDRVLAEMTRRVFYASFSAKVIDAKWPAFEEGFCRFDPNTCAFMLEEHFERLMRDHRIVRHGAKIKSVQINAQFVLSLRVEHGSAARFFAEWPDADCVGLRDILKKRASQLGGDASGWFLRAIGKPAFIVSRDVAIALIREGVVRRSPNGKRDLAVVQTALNRWSRESGRDLTAISRVLAMSVDSDASVARYLSTHR